MNNNTAQEVYNLQEAKEMNFPKKEAVSNEIYTINYLMK